MNNACLSRILGGILTPLPVLSARGTGWWSLHLSLPMSSKTAPHLDYWQIIR